MFTSRSRRQARVKSNADTAADLMTSPAVTAEPETPLAQAARMLDEHNVKRLPVVDASRQLVGIVSRADLLRIYLRADEQISQEIHEGVLRKTLWIDPKLVDVTVDAGVVSLRGQVDRKTTAMLIAHLCAGVAGVTEVRDELTWDFDDAKITDPA